MALRSPSVVRSTSSTLGCHTFAVALMAALMATHRACSALRCAICARRRSIAVGSSEEIAVFVSATCARA